MKARRTIILVIVLVLVAALPAVAQSRLGAAFGIPNGVLVYRPSPVDLKFGYDFSDGNQFLFASGDIRLIDNRQITGVLHGSFGVGLYGKLYPEGRDDTSDSVDFDWGTRLPIAASVLLIDNFLEFFLEVAPGLDVYPKLAFSDQPVQLFAGFTVQLDR